MADTDKRIEECVKEDMDSLEKALQDDGRCTTGVVAGMTPEDVVRKYPKIVIAFMKNQQAKIDGLELELEQMKMNKDKQND